MCLLLATASMIDKTVTFVSVMLVILRQVSSAPASTDDKSLEDASATKRNSSNVPFISNFSSISPIPEPAITLPSTRRESIEMNMSPPTSDKAQLQVTPSNAKSTLKPRKNKKDLYFCCTEDNLERTTEPIRRGKDRERNTKPPVLKRGKNPESEEEPSFERRPALLLRFFPDGTAVLISKFQLHLHVKPKQIKFEPDEKEDETLELNPGLILNDGNGFEVTYKRLETIPGSREQNIFDVDESEENEAYSDNGQHKDHEFVTTSIISTTETKRLFTDSKPIPIQESTTFPTLTETIDTPQTSVPDVNKGNKSEKIAPTVGDSPFFIMTSEEMSSLQQQYDPIQASPLKATTTILPTEQNSTKLSEETKTTQMPPTTVSTRETTVVTEESTVLSTTTTKCVSFRNQLSLALSTEDNIDNSLLKRQIFPTEDCNSSDTQTSNSPAKLQLKDTTTRMVTTALPIITRPRPEPPTTQIYTRNNLVPYLASQFSNHPSKPDVVVVTSLPVLIDLKSTRNEPVTDVPAWREVTVGVVRDQQGQPLKPRYNNWTAHLRGLRKKPENKFWNDFTTPKPDFRQHEREPLQQNNFQQSPSQINRSFWSDLQRQRQVPDQRRKDSTNAQLYRTNPPRNYPAQNENEFQFWRNRVQNMDNRWNANANSQVPDFERTRGPLRNPPQRSYENQESRQNQQWSHGNPQPNHRRW